MGRARPEPGAAPRQPKGRLNVTTDNQPISAARAAALLLALVPELARVELYPQWSDGNGEVVRRTRAVPYDGEGRIIEFPPVEQAVVSAVLRRIGDMDPYRPESLDVVTGEVTPVAPPPVPLWLSPAAVPELTAGWLPNGGHDADCAYVGGLGSCTCSPTAGVPDAGALLGQRHQVEDPSVPPLGGAQPDPARDYAASLAAGHVQPVAWDDDAPCEPVFVERDTVDVPVQGGAL
jgi:hypothetical protein